jgi:AcrR family transcriptional regulator
MTVVSRANYNSPRREQAAAATKEAILDATRQLFATQGYGRTTVGQIAESAQVAVNTVYTSIGGKPQLLAAIMEYGTHDPAVAETLAAVAHATDPAAVIRLTAAGTRQVNERHSTEVAILFESARVDDVAAELLHGVQRRYRDHLDVFVQRLRDLDALAPSDRSRATDIFWYLFGWTSWRTLISELGWSWDDAEKWLADRGVEALLER